MRGMSLYSSLLLWSLVLHLCRTTALLVLPIIIVVILPVIIMFYPISRETLCRHSTCLMSVRCQPASMDNCMWFQGSSNVKHVNADSKKKHRLERFIFSCAEVGTGAFTAFHVYQWHSYQWSLSVPILSLRKVLILSSKGRGRFQTIAGWLV